MDDGAGLAMQTGDLAAGIGDDFEFHLHGFHDHQGLAFADL